MNKAHRNGKGMKEGRGGKEETEQGEIRYVMDMDNSFLAMNWYYVSSHHPKYYQSRQTNQCIQLVCLLLRAYGVVYRRKKVFNMGAVRSMYVHMRGRAGKESQ